MTEILWVDNDCLSVYKDFQEVIKSHGYKVEAKEYVPEAIELLNKDVNRFAAVIVDARGKMTSDDPEDLGSLKYFETEIIKVWSKKYIPYYIYTGQPNVYESETFKEEHKVFYKKGLDDDKLFAKMESDLQKLPELQIEYMYSSVLDAARKIKLNKKKVAKLINLLKGLHFLEGRPTEPNKNALRAILCSILKIYYKYGLVPDECLRSGSNLLIYDDVREYLSGQRAVHTFGGSTTGGVMDASGPVFGEVMAQHLEDIMNYVNAGSHEEGDDDDEDDDEVDETLIKLDADVNERYESYDAALDNNMLFYSYLLQICDLIRYTANYLKANSNPEVNLERRVRLYEVFIDNPSGATAKVEVDDDGIPHCGPCELAPDKKNPVAAGDVIQIFKKNKSYADGFCHNRNHSDTYPFYLKSYKKVF